MTRSVTKVARSGSDLKTLPDTEDMLADASFQARLAKARQDRERVLSCLGGDDVPLRRQKPWETASDDITLQAKTRRRTPLILTPQDLYLGSDMASDNEAAEPPRLVSPREDVPLVSDRTRLRGGALLIVGLCAGIGIGYGLSQLPRTGFGKLQYTGPDGAGGQGDRPGRNYVQPDVLTARESQDPDAPPDAVPPFADEAVHAVIEAPATVPRRRLSVLAEMQPVLDHSTPVMARVGFASHDEDVPMQPVLQNEPPDRDPPVVYLNAPSALTEAAVKVMSDALEQTGLTLESIRRVDLSVNRSNVRFFHAVDANTARSMAEKIGALPLDFSHYRPSPPVGTIEIWLAGRTAATSQPAPAARRADQDEQLLLLRRQLLERLIAAEGQ